MSQKPILDCRDNPFTIVSNWSYKIEDGYIIIDYQKIDNEKQLIYRDGHFINIQALKSVIYKKSLFTSVFNAIAYRMVKNCNHVLNREDNLTFQIMTDRLLDMFKMDN